MDESIVLKPKSTLQRFFTEHWIALSIGFLGGIASIGALVLAFFPWLTSPKRELRFCTHPHRVSIVQAAKSAEISINYKGFRVQGNLTAAQVTIWNSGREPIKTEDILSPIVVSISTNCPILEFTVLKTKRNVIGFQIDSTNADSGLLGLHWKILEKGDAALIQIVYAGPAESPISMQGTIVGQPFPVEVFPRELESQQNKKALKMFLGVLSMQLSATLIFLLSLTASKQWMKMDPETANNPYMVTIIGTYYKTKEVDMGFLSLISFNVCVMLADLLIVLIKDPQPRIIMPFDF